MFNPWFWLLGVVLVGCTSLDAEDYRHVHCEIWSNSKKDRHALSFSYQTIAEKTLPVVSTGKGGLSFYVKDMEKYVIELNALCDDFFEFVDQD